MTDDKKPASAGRVIKVGEYDVLVDEEDYPLLSRYTWHIQESHGSLYARTNVYFNGTRRIISMHRLVMGMRNMSVDHINRNGLDNQKHNLRFCTRDQNQFNSRRKSKLGFKGVILPAKNKSYLARIKAKGKTIKLGLFKTAEEAAIAYDKAALKYFGEFAALNFPNDRAKRLTGGGK